MRFDVQPVMSRSLNVTRPRRGGVKPTMERMSVVLPMPLRPSTPTTSPRCTPSDTPCST
jgi:hypothetical protein